MKQAAVCVSSLGHHSADHQLQRPRRRCTRMMLGREHPVCALSGHNSRPHLFTFHSVEHLRADNLLCSRFLCSSSPFEHSELLHLCEVGSDSSYRRITIQDLARSLITELSGLCRRTPPRRADQPVPWRRLAPASHSSRRLAAVRSETRREVACGLSSLTMALNSPPMPLFVPEAGCTGCPVPGWGWRVAAALPALHCRRAADNP